MQCKTLANVWIKSQTPSRKIILVLHGRGDSYEGFDWLPEALQLSDVNYLMVNAPDKYADGFSWYALPPKQLPGITRSSRLLDQLLAELKDSGFASEDIVVFGFSQGCLMALEWGGRCAQRFAGFVAISGYCYDEKLLAKEFSPAASQSKWLVTHGTKDDLLPFATSKAQIEFLQSVGLPIEFHSFPKAHTIDPRRELPLIKTWIQQAFSS